MLGNSVNTDIKAYALDKVGGYDFVQVCSISVLIGIINSHLDANRPIKVGVNYRKGGNKSDGLTDHWVVIIGRNYDTGNGKYYYNYIETGRTSSNSVNAVKDNRLYYDSAKNTISGIKYNKKSTYYLNQIRTNK